MALIIVIFIHFVLYKGLGFQVEYATFLFCKMFLNYVDFLIGMYRGCSRSCVIDTWHYAPSHYFFPYSNEDVVW